VDAAAPAAVTAPIVGIVTAPNGTTRDLSGTFTPTSFVADGERLLARGARAPRSPSGRLDRVVLNIDAVLGGGLLGDLLCAIANILNGGLPLSNIAVLLNEILRLLGQ
jgi:hypothetical protein